VAWSQCAGSLFLFFNGFGMINSFGKLSEVDFLLLKPALTLAKACSKATTSRAVLAVRPHPVSDCVDWITSSLPIDWRRRFCWSTFRSGILATPNIQWDCRSSMRLDDDKLVYPILAIYSCSGSDGWAWLWAAVYS